MSDKPSYIGTLNAIVNGERRGFESLTAWAAASNDPEVSGMLKTVALREGEHAAAFEKRLCELGYGLREKQDPNFSKTMEIVTSDMSDFEKFEALRSLRGDNEGANEDGKDGLLQLLADKTIDPQTAGLMGRFIAEERDSGRILKAAHDCARSKAAPTSDAVTLSQVCEQLAKLTEAVSELQSAKKTKVRAVKS